MSKPLFSRDFIDTLEILIEKEGYELQDLLDVAANHVNFRARVGNHKESTIKVAVEQLNRVESSDYLFELLNNKLAKYEESVNSRNVKNKINKK